ncbi:MAG: NDP-sugar synthase [Proteobacteria bacterium]|nr:NDP-sugar synthase [Desulfobulbaceae bacterium]MBU4151685.1 NDP-sugar synthase [Pseudomonadota bacterium]
MKAMVLAAGLGTRLRPYSLLRPKPLFPVLGQPLILRIIGQLRSAGFGPIIVNAFHLADQLMAILADQPDIILQRELIELGTGGGLRMARNHFDNEPVLITNADIYHDIDYEAVMVRHGQNRCPITMVMQDHPRFNKVAVRNGQVLGFANGPLTVESGAAAHRLAFTGIHVVDPIVLDDIPLSCFYSIIDRYQEHLQAGGMIKAMTVTGHFWQDIGTLNDYLGLHQFLLNDHLPSFMLGENVDIGQGVKLEDWGYIGDRVIIGDGASLARVVVWDGAVIAPGSSLTDCLVTA